MTRSLLVLAAPLLFTVACDGAGLNEPCFADKDCGLAYVCYIEVPGDEGVCFEPGRIPADDSGDSGDTDDE